MEFPKPDAGVAVYPELLRDKIQPERIVRELRGYLDDPVHKQEVDRRLETARNAMGTTRAAVFWARAIAEALENKTKDNAPKEGEES
jgi:lipid A disaccharide synthetase